MLCTGPVCQAVVGVVYCVVRSAFLPHLPLSSVVRPVLYLSAAWRHRNVTAAAAERPASSSWRTWVDC